MKEPHGTPLAVNNVERQAVIDPLPFVPATWIAFHGKLPGWTNRLMRDRPNSIMIDYTDETRPLCVNCKKISLLRISPCGTITLETLSVTCQRLGEKSSEKRKQVAFEGRFGNEHFAKRLVRSGLIHTYFYLIRGVVRITSFDTGASLCGDDFSN